MANKSKKYPNNIPGAYYVDDSCIACDACTLAAANHFAMDDNDGHAFVKLQPQTPAELEACLEAKESCPVEAIGDDGP